MNHYVCISLNFRIAKWIANEPERKKKKLEEKQKKLKRYKNAPKHKFDDPTYMEQIRDVEENMDSALKQGMDECSFCSMSRTFTLLFVFIHACRS